MKQLIGAVLVLFVTFNSVAVLAATSDPNKIKSEITRRGTGEKARVRITTRDNVQMKGYISAIGESTFVIVLKHGGETRTLPYSDVVQVRGPGLSTASKVGIGIGALAAGTGIAAAVILGKCGNYCR